VRQFARRICVHFFCAGGLLASAASAAQERPRTRVFLPELQLAAPVILAGIQTAMVISVGTATIGALPAAALAVALELAFSALQVYGAGRG